MKTSKNNKVAQGIGRALAYIQDTFDVAFNWGFYKLKKVKIKEEEKHQGKKKAKKAANKILHFFAELGNSFYTEYEKIKSKRNQK